MKAPYREPIRYAEDGPAAVSRAITLGPYAVQRYRGPVPAERLHVARPTAQATVAEKIRNDRAIEAKKEKRKRREAAPGRPQVYATDAERKAAKEQRRKERLAAEGWTPKKSGPKPKYSDEERKARRRERARAKYRETHPECRPTVKAVIAPEPRQRRKPGPAPLPKPVEIPRDICPHANDRKSGLAADGRQIWKCLNCGRKRTDSPRGAGRPRIQEAA